MKIACDWDDTLVDVHTQEWLPGALEWLRTQLLCGSDVFVHTCRANWPEGRASVEATLAAEGLKLEIVGKPFADVYIDDKAEKVGPLLLGDRKSGFVQARAASPRTIAGIFVY